MFNPEKEKRDISRIFQRIFKRDFSGETGTAIRNSSYQFLISVFAKVGSLFFTILMARILLPERMGLYSLALTTIVFFNAFSDLGLSNAIITYIPKALSKKNSRKAKAYFSFLLKWKLLLIGLVSFVILASSYFIANSYYNKPIFYALLVSGIYLFSTGLWGFYEQLFKSLNNFKISLKKEILFQSLRLSLIPLGAIFVLKQNLSNQLVIMSVILILSLCYLLSFVYLFFKSKKEIPFLKNRASSLSKEDVKDLKKFILPLIVTILSGVFFGYIDIIMLGHYVASEFISYYTTTLNLVSSLSLIIGFIATGIFPIMASLKGEKLDSIFKKATKYSSLISLLCSLGVLIFASFIIRLIYGPEYLASAQILRYYCILIFISPLIALYENYLISQKNTKPLANLLTFTTLINIVLNFFFIRYGLNNLKSSMAGVLGACFATIISRVVYFIGLIAVKKKRN